MMNEKKCLMYIFLPVFAAAMCFAPSECAAPEKPANIVVYNRNFAVISEKITLLLESGENTVRLTNIPETLQPDSMSIEFEDPSDTVILEHKLIPPATEASLLKFNEGNIVEFEITSPHTGERWVRKGKIIRAGGDPIV